MNTVRGEYSSAYIYSLIESAKSNDLKPYGYFKYIITKLPTLDMTSEADLETVMPWAALPEELYNKKS